MDEDVVAQWMRMWWLSGWGCGVSVDGDVVAQWMRMWFLSRWGCGGLFRYFLEKVWPSIESSESKGHILVPT